MNSKVLTDGWVPLGTYPRFAEFSELSESEKRLKIFIDHDPLPHKDCIRVYRKGDNIVVGLDEACFAFARNRFYIRHRYTTICTVTPKRVFCTDKIYNVLVRYFNLPFEIYTKKSIRHLLTKGPEGLEKEDDKFVHYILKSDVKTYTTDYKKVVENLDLKVWDRDLLRDTIDQAKALDRKIKAEWSSRKLSDIHGRWTREIQDLKARNCSTEPVWLNFPSLPEGVRLINSERECADEGSTMHHCIYTNYWYYIKDKKYVALHVTDIDGDYTIGCDYKVVYTDDDKWVHKLVFNQAFKAWNKPITDRQKDTIPALIASINSELIKM